MTSPPPKPCTARPSTNTHMAPAVPEITSPEAKAAIPTVSGRSGPCRSAHWPTRTMPKRLVVK